MIIFPGSKVNLGLRITEKRSDGYHNLQTVFYPLAFSDVLEAIPSGSTTLKLSGIAIPGKKEDNLVLKVVERLSRHYKIPGFQIHLHKVIPSGTGLGGGSADAAAMIKGVNQLAGLHLTQEQMIAIASELGADCAFFIKNRPVYATEKGSRFESINLSLQGYKIVVVIPDVSVNTSDAYRQITPQFPEESVRETVQKPIFEWADALINDFEQIAALPPEILHIKKRLYKAGASYAAMSGSGSAVFGLFTEDAHVDLGNLSAYKVRVEDALY